LKKAKSMVKKGRGGMTPTNTKGSALSGFQSKPPGSSQGPGRTATRSEAPLPHAVPQTTLSNFTMTRAEAVQVAELQMSPTAASPSRPGMGQASSLPGAVPEESMGFTGVLPEPKSPVVCASCGGAAEAAKKAAMVAPASLAPASLTATIAQEALHGAAQPAMGGHHAAPFAAPQPPPPTSQALDQEAASTDRVEFDGDWGNATNLSANIRGKSLTFGNGDKAELAFPSARQVQMFYEGGTYQGEYQKDGKLHWCDGDIWTRTYPSSGLESKNFGSLLSPMAQQSQLQQQWLPPAPPG